MPKSCVEFDCHNPRAEGTDGRCEECKLYAKLVKSLDIRHPESDGFKQLLDSYLEKRLARSILKVLEELDLEGRIEDVNKRVATLDTDMRILRGRIES